MARHLGRRGVKPRASSPSLVRAFGSRTTRTCQAEAIAPDILAQIVRDAIESRIDHKALRRVLAREKRVRRELIKKLEVAT